MSTGITATCPCPLSSFSSDACAYGVLPPVQVEAVIETIITEARTGEIGDGKIFGETWRTPPPRPILKMANEPFLSGHAVFVPFLSHLYLIFISFLFHFFVFQAYDNCTDTLMLFPKRLHLSLNRSPCAPKNKSWIDSTPLSILFILIN